MVVREEPHQDLAEYEEDEAEETLSFCDLPIYSDSAHWKKEDQSFSSSSSSSSDQDYFEFFSGEWSTSSTAVSDSIIFCGKVIPFRQPKSPQKLEKKSRELEKPRQRGGFFRWKLNWLVRKRSSRRSKKKEIRRATSLPAPEKCGYKEIGRATSLPASEKCGHKAGKGGERYGFSVRRLSIFASATKSRWHLMFGLTRLPVEMELKDIRSRQSRRNPVAMFPLVEGREGEKGRTGKGLWAMIRALSLGCGNVDSSWEERGIV
ncbi:hypothetical protein NMG60_11018627 [Bertholletia excelsa]